MPTTEALVIDVPAEHAATPHRLTYGELAERVHRLTHVLAGAGVGPRDRVGIVLPRRAEYLETLLAAFALRAVPIGLNTLFSAGEMAEVIGDSHPRLVVHDAELAAPLPVGVPALARGEAYERALAAAPTRPRPVEGRSGDDHYVLYTGGTTGRPRRVLWRHDDLRAAALAPADIELAGRRVLVCCPLYHGTGQWMALAALLAGGTVLLSSAASSQPEHLLDLAERERVTHLVITGDVYARPLVDALEAEPSRWMLDALTVVLSGGAPLTPALTARLLTALPTTMVVDGYGATETGGHATSIAVAGGIAARAPVFRVDDDTAVLDDSLRPIPMDDPTEGWLARCGPLPLGYEDDPERTAQTFPVVDGQRWAIPGDRAHWVGPHRMEILGRGTLTVNTGGEKVHPEEVEDVLRLHELVADAVVVGTPDERWGEVVTAVVQPAGLRLPTLAELAEHCRASLAPFKVPRRLVLVEAVHRSASGKPDYRWARSTVD